MSVLMAPVLDKEAWPTLGPAVCQFIEENLVFGPGDLRGQPAVLDPEKRINQGPVMRLLCHEGRGKPDFEKASGSSHKRIIRNRIVVPEKSCIPNRQIRQKGYEKNKPRRKKPRLQPLLFRSTSFQSSPGCLFFRPEFHCGMYRSLSIKMLVK